MIYFANFQKTPAPILLSLSIVLSIALYGHLPADEFFLPSSTKVKSEILLTQWPEPDQIFTLHLLEYWLMNSIIVILPSAKWFLQIFCIELLFPETFCWHLTMPSRHEEFVRRPQPFACKVGKARVVKCRASTAGFALIREGKVVMKDLVQSWLDLGVFWLLLKKRGGQEILVCVG